VHTSCPHGARPGLLRAGIIPGKGGLICLFPGDIYTEPSGRVLPLETGPDGRPRRKTGGVTGGTAAVGPTRVTPVPPAAPIITTTPSGGTMRHPLVGPTIQQRRGSRPMGVRLPPGVTAVAPLTPLQLSVCSFLPSPAKEICQGVGDIFLGDDEPTILDPLGPGLNGADPLCGPGFVLDQSGICVAIGSPGDISTGISGGEGQAVNGRFGAALTPTITQEIVRRCLPGQLLGKDNLCYEKLDQDEKKYRTPPKPLATSAEVKTLQKAQRIRGRINTALGTKKFEGLDFR